MGELSTKKNRNAYEKIIVNDADPYIKKENLDEVYRSSPPLLSHTSTNIEGTGSLSAHASTHHSGGNDALLLSSIAGTIGDAKIVDLSYTKLSDVPEEFNPSAHTHIAENIISGILSIDRLPETLVHTDDFRLSNARIPLNHSTSHKTGGIDTIKLDELSAPDDNTNLDVSSLKHGLFPKLPNTNANRLFREDGTWVTPQSSVNGVGSIRGKKWGSDQCVHATSIGGGGMFVSAINTGQVTVLNNTATGPSGVRLTSGAVSGSNAGRSYNGPSTMAEFNPYFGIRCKLNHIALNRIYLGLRNVQNQPNAGDESPLTLFNPGIILLTRSIDNYSNFWIHTGNNPVGSSFMDTGIPVTDQEFTFEFQLANDGTTGQYSYNKGAWTDITIPMPTMGINLRPSSFIQTAEDIAHQIEIYDVEMTSDR